MEAMTKDKKKWFDNYFGRNKKQKMYNLLFNDEILLLNAPYPVCVKKKNELIKSGLYKGFKNYFHILPY